MRLEEGDIALRPFTEADVPAITAACQDPEIPRWTSVPSPYSEDDARSFVAEPGDHRAFAVVDASTDALLGSVGFWLEGHGRAGFGYWTRALRLLTRWAAREHDLARLQLMVEPANAASIRVAEKVGFRREGLLRSYLELKGTRRDVFLYSLLPEEI